MRNSLPVPLLCFDPRIQSLRHVCPWDATIRKGGTVFCAALRFPGLGQALFFFPLPPFCREAVLGRKESRAVLGEGDRGLVIGGIRVCVCYGDMNSH